MKKNLFIATLVASSMGFVSCSDDDNSNNNGNNNPDVELFASSNTTGMISYTDLTMSSPAARMMAIESMNVDGIFYNEDFDEIVVASRTNNRLEAYGNFRAAMMGNLTALTMTAASANGEFTNAREIVADGNRVIVVQDQDLVANGNQNKILVYQRTAAGFVKEKEFNVAFKLWGLEVRDGNLFVVEDLSSRMAVFNNLYSRANGNITPDKTVSIEGLVRTHGIEISDEGNMLVLTDVGDAASDSDGGVIVIENFTNVWNNTVNNGTIMMNSQKRIYGTNTMLGNPVDVAVDDEGKRIFVAERLNGGGRVLGFSYPTTATSNPAPTMNRLEAGSTSVYIRD